MQVLTNFETSIISAGTRVVDTDSSYLGTQSYLKTRCTSGALMGALLGLNISSASLITYVFAGFSAGLAIGMFETWLLLD